MGDRWTTAPTLSRVTIGDPLTPELARSVAREVTEHGGFADVTIEAEPLEDGARLRVLVLPSRRVVSIRTFGTALDLEATLEAARIREGAEITARDLATFAGKITRFYAEHGYTAAEVRVDASDTDKPTDVVLSIVVRPGTPRTITERRFDMVPAAAREVGALTDMYRVDTGARVDEQVLGQADREFTEALRTRGFYRAAVTHSLEYEGARTTLTIAVDAGRRTVTWFEGNRSFDTDKLTEALELGKPTSGAPEELVGRLQNFYVQRGFLDVEITTTETPRKDQAVSDLSFHVRENSRVSVARRVFPCLPQVWPAGATTFTPDKLGDEITSFLEEELPGGAPPSPVAPSEVDAIFGPTEGSGGRATPLVMDPSTTYAPETYERAVKHLRDLFRSDGYLHALVGPVSVVRSTCRRRSPAGSCMVAPAPVGPLTRCATDRQGLPIAEPSLPETLTCVPDPKRGIACSPEVTLRIPVQLGPRTLLYDMAFEGNVSLPEQRLAEITALDLGGPLSNAGLEAARLRIIDAYQDVGFAYVDVRVVVEPSPDRSRARARFVVIERDPVKVGRIVLKGATRTDPEVVLGRIALHAGDLYTRTLVRQSEERLATLGVFSSVSLGLENPDLPEPVKNVVVTVAEQLPQYLDPRIGFSTGDGLRFAFEYGNRNIAGRAVSLTLRVQLSYLFDAMILDPAVRQNLGPLPVSQRLERRNTITVNLPEIGLGPTASLSFAGIDVRDNQRDFGLTRQALLPTLQLRPRRGLRADLGGSVELNDVAVFNEPTVEAAIKANPALTRLLRVPDGRTLAVSQRIGVTLDNRDNAFAATRGNLIAGVIEHVDALPASSGSTPSITSHFLRMTARAAGYVRLSPRGTSLALSLAGGYNLQLDAQSKTYPDRLFFLGGVDSIRGFLIDSVVPEDIAQRILHPQSGQTRLSIGDVGIRGGDVYLNPRLELRLPLNDAFALGVFVDSGNLWVDPKAIDLTALHYATGAGLRVVTPVGPLALDYGINLDSGARKAALNEDMGAFHFSIGLF